MAMLAEYAQGDHPRIRGENARLPPYKRRKPDHPRIRGENSEQTGQHWVFEGSPPHTRGKFKFLDPLFAQLRITPAYAGKIHQASVPSARSGDHPRIRGENMVDLERSSDPSGSPPHTRGKSRHLPPPPHPQRITPAYAGKIERQLRVVHQLLDHPRIRGENSFSTMEQQMLEGSPPHTRGKFQKNDRAFRDVRITPAYAGKIKSQGRFEEKA